MPALRLPRDLIAGAAVGLVTGLFGVGGGLLIVRALLADHDCEDLRVRGAIGRVDAPHPCLVVCVWRPVLGRRATVFDLMEAKQALDAVDR